jgi:hypothetical protein
MIQQPSFNPAHLALLTSSDPYRTEPASLAATFTLTAEQRQRMTGLNDACRRFEIGLLLYAHIYSETCRIRHVAILSSPSERALQRAWQAQQAELIDDVVTRLLRDDQAPRRSRAHSAPQARHEPTSRRRARGLTAQRERAAAAPVSARR